MPLNANELLNMVVSATSGISEADPFKVSSTFRAMFLEVLRCYYDLNRLETSKWNPEVLAEIMSRQLPMVASTYNPEQIEVEEDDH